VGRRSYCSQYFYRKSKEMKMKRYSNTGEKEVARLYILRHHRFTLPSLTRPGADPKNRKSFSLILIRSLCSVIMFFGLAMTCLSTTQIDIVGDISSTALGRGVVYTLPNGNIVLIDAQYSSPYFFAGRVYLYDGNTAALISTLSGDSFYDEVGNGGIRILSNGNFVVRSSRWSGTGAANDDFGAVTFCSGVTGCNGVVSAANSLVGSNVDDEVGSSFIFPLANGNYLVRSAKWDNGSLTDAGAVTFCSGTVGCTGVVSAQNSLIGTTANDKLGFNTPIVDSTGHYFIQATGWDNNGIVEAGALRVCDTGTGCMGTITPANSLVGTSPFDRVGSSLRLMSNGDYVTSSKDWDNGAVADVGVSTYCSGTTPCTGPVTTANSLYGTSAADGFGGVRVLETVGGHYTVGWPWWDNGSAADVGAVTFCSGGSSCIGPVTTANSSYGSSPTDRAGYNLTLTNGNYIVGGRFTNGTASEFGSLTFCNGTSGCTGPITAANSLYGTTVGDSIGNVLTALLPNGNYVVVSSLWQNPNGEKGATTWCSGTLGCIGPVTPTNSLVTNDTAVGGVFDGGNDLGVTVLANGNYVVNNALWDNGSIRDVGAYTFCDGAIGCRGTVSPSNSLVGTSGHDGFDPQGLNLGFTTPLKNGDYVVSNIAWDNTAAIDAGAATLCSGRTGCQGVISMQNSLIGGTTGDNVGASVIELSNGNFVVRSTGWDNGSLEDVGALTWCRGSEGCAGPVTAVNSLVGSSADDGVGSEVVPTTNGNYYVRSLFWNNGSITDAGAVTIGNGRSGTVGTINSGNSVLGRQNSINFGATAVDYVNNQLVVGHGNDRVSLLRPVLTTPFDFDGDGRSDLAVFRASEGNWYRLHSRDGSFAARLFGLSTDKLVPADFDGDGKTDHAVFRDGTWWILGSSSGQVAVSTFGQAGDLPVPADFDADGKADICVFRPSSGTWYRQNSSNGQFVGAQFGQDGDTPMLGDYDGDGRSDLALFRPATGVWYVSRSSDGQTRSDPFGQSGDIPLNGDFNGDGRSDLAVFRPSEGYWYVASAAGVPAQNFDARPFGISTDIPLPADYDGDGRTDIAIYRNGQWWIRSSTGTVSTKPFGLSSDKPIESAFLP
jgi:hypothetical protein